APALLVGRHLRLEVGDVLRRIARRPAPALEQRLRLLLEEATALDQLDVVELDALLLDAGRERRHRARRRAADVGMVAAGPHVERGAPRQAAVMEPLSPTLSP